MAASPDDIESGSFITIDETRCSVIDSISAKDSVSQVGSTTSSLASSVARTSARRAALEARSRVMMRQQKLDMEQLQQERLQKERELEYERQQKEREIQRQRLEMEADLAAVIAEETELKRIMEAQSGQSENLINSNHMDDVQRNSSNGSHQNSVPCGDGNALYSSHSSDIYHVVNAQRNVSNGSSDNAVQTCQMKEKDNLSVSPLPVSDVNVVNHRNNVRTYNECNANTCDANVAHRNLSNGNDKTGIQGCHMNENQNHNQLNSDLSRSTSQSLHNSIVHYEQGINACSSPTVHHHYHPLPHLSNSHQETNHLAKVIDIMQLSSTSVPTFCGEPKEYALFIHSFDTSVDRLSVDSQYKLSKLLECCKGKAYDIIKPCALMDAERGYCKAKDLLRERFGDPHRIANACVKSVTNGPQFSSSEALQEYADQLTEVRETMASLGKLSKLDFEDNMLKIVSRLPPRIQRKWQDEAWKYHERNLGEDPSFVYLVEFIKRQAAKENFSIYNTVGLSSRIKTDNSVKVQSKSKSFVVSQSKPPVKEIKGYTCYVCHGDHKVSDCITLANMEPADRLAVVKLKKLCYNCLNYSNHGASKCVKGNQCSKGCRMKHSELLHDALMIGKVPDKEPNSITQTTQSITNTATSCASKNNVSIALPVVPVIVTADGKSVKTLALLDTGSTLTFCAESLVNKLCVNPTKCKSLKLDTITETSETNVKLINLECSSISGKSQRQTVDLEDVHILKKFPSFDGQTATKEDVKGWSHLNDVPYEVENQVEVELLIGQDCPTALIPLDIRKGINGPYAIRTILGWSINGPLTSSKNVAMCNFVREAKLETLVENMWKIENSYGEDITEPFSGEDKQVVDLWNSEVKFKNGHYELPIPLKENFHMPDNRVMAEKRLVSLGRKLKRDGELREKYHNNITDLVNKGYAERIVKDTDKQGMTWYIPHHNVVHKKKPEKFRMVFDCAAQYGSASLNTSIMQGPDLMNSLIGVLLRFRLHEVAVTSDIEGMFHQIRVVDEHRDLLRFLWWKNGDPSNEIEVYRMTAHLFGGIWSPSCANFALKQVAKDEDKASDKVKEVINTNFYVDDCMVSIETVEEAIKLAAELSESLQNRGFHLTKWNSNKPDFLASITEDEKSKNVNKTERALGVQWDTLADELAVNVESTDTSYTKRGLLKTIASVYDPLGLVGPTVLLAKKIFQDECRKSKGWDVEMEEENKVKFDKWLNQVLDLNKFRVPRCMMPSNPSSIEIHVFSDASTDGYGAVAYIRASNEDQVHVTFAMAKCKLAPIEQTTIPRLELCAAVIGSKLGALLIKQLAVDAEVYYWTDSMITLSYIKNKTRRFKTFVANRIAKITRNSNISQWNYVPGKLNPADIASRGLAADQLIASEMWKNGPAFLKSAKSEWPKLPDDKTDTLPDDDKEVKSLVTVSRKTDDLMCSFDTLCSHYSSLFKLKRAVVYLKKFVSWMKTKSVSTAITVLEMQEAENCLVHYVQRCHFADEIKCLQANSSIPATSSLYKLDPYLDLSNILRVNGRLCNSSLQESVKHPILLHRNHIFTEMVVKHVHENISRHAGREYVMAAVRERYWIPQARSLIRNILNNCFICKLMRKSPNQQKMANLPTDRIEPNKYPFEQVGVDIFGPFMVKRGRSLEKRYCCIFTCLTMRAVHLEILHSLEADAFLNSLIRFIARRGCPKLIRSDNGTNFVGACKEINESIMEWNNHVKLQQELLVRNIEWKFNPPSSSNFGGVWERMIRCVRNIFSVTLKNQVLTDEKLRTFACEAEGIVNNRPLTPVSEDPKDYKALTPRDLLHVSTVFTSSPGEFVKEDVFRKSWRHVQFLVDDFWRRWLKEYLPTLQPRNKWLTSQNNIKVDDLVLVKDESVPRNSWPLARVVETYISKDKLVRSVKIKTASGVYTRPVNKLCLLESSSVHSK